MFSIREWGDKESQSWKDFQTMCDQNGYEAKWSSPGRDVKGNFYYIRLDNGLKVEYKMYGKTNKAILGYLELDDDKKAKIIEAVKGTKWESKVPMALKDLQEAGANNKSLDNFIPADVNSDIEFWELVNFLKSISLGYQAHRIDLEPNYRSLFKMIKGSIDGECEWVIRPDILRRFTQVETINPKLPVDNWQEHLVCIIERWKVGKKMIRNRCSEDDYVKFMFETAGVYNISKADQEKVDAKNRITMPDGWKPGDNIFARLEAVGVEYDIKLYEDFKKRLKIV